VLADDHQLSEYANKEQIFGKIRRGAIQRRIKLGAGKRDMIVRQLDRCRWKIGGLTATKKDAAYEGDYEFVNKMESFPVSWRIFKTD